MNTITVEKNVGEKGFSFVVRCKKCGAWLAKANKGMGLDQRNCFNRCICGEQADGREIVEARGDQPAEWLARCTRCSFEIKDVYCDPAAIAAQIVNEQWRWNCIDPGRTHSFLLYDMREAGKLIGRVDHVSLKEV